MKLLAVWTPVVGAALLAPLVLSAGCGGCECVTIIEPSRPQCSERQRSLRTAIFVYLADYDDVLPLAESWQDATGPYVGTFNQRNYKCPEIEAMGGENFGIAYNAAIGGLVLNKITDPLTVMTFDSTILTRNANSSLSTLPSPARHGSNVIVRFDGTVASEPRPR